MTSKMAYDLTYKTGVSNIELDEIISKNHYYSFRYAIEVLQGRFELGEEIISKKGYNSYHYALNVLKDRFRLGEKVIMQDIYLYYSVGYFDEILGYGHD